MSTPVDDRPAHKGYPDSLNLLGSRISDVFGVPVSLAFAMDQAGRYRRRAEERMAQSFFDEAQRVIDQVGQEFTAKLRSQMLEEPTDD